MFKNLAFEDWLRGLVAAIISGGSSAVVGSVVISSKYPQAGVVELMWSLFLANGLLGMFLYLKQKPVPDLKEVSVKREGMEVAGVLVGPQKVTVTETHKEPAEPAEQPKP